LTQTDAAIRRIKAVLIIQVLAVPVLWFHWYIMWASDELPDLMVHAQHELLLLLLYPLASFYWLRKKKLTHGLKIYLYGIVYFDLALPGTLALTMLLFGGNLVPLLSSSLLLVPATLVLIFVRTHEFEPDHIHTEADEFDVFMMEIEAHPSVDEGLEYVVNYIEEHHDEFSSGYTDRLLAYLSERNDEIGLAARTPMRGPFADEDERV